MQNDKPLDATLEPREDPVNSETLIRRMEETFEEFERDDARSTASLHRWLGTIHEVAPQVEGNVDWKFDLIAKVKKHPDIRGNKAFKAEQKSVLELCLTLKLGTKTRRGRKSNYLAALREARERRIEPSCTAFVEWISRLGVGVGGAASLYRKRIREKKEKDLARERKANPPPTIQELVKEIPPGPETGTKISLRLPKGLRFPSGYGILIFHAVDAEPTSTGETTATVDRALADDEIVLNVVVQAKDHSPLTRETLRPARGRGSLDDAALRRLEDLGAQDAEHIAAESEAEGEAAVQEFMRLVDEESI